MILSGDIGVFKSVKHLTLRFDVNGSILSERKVCDLNGGLT